MTDQLAPSVNHAAVCEKHTSQSTSLRKLCPPGQLPAQRSVAAGTCAPAAPATHQRAGHHGNAASSKCEFPSSCHQTIASGDDVKGTAWASIRRSRLCLMALRAAERWVRQRHKTSALGLRTCKGRRNASSRLMRNRCCIQNRPATSPVTKPVIAAPKCRNVRPMAISSQLVTKQSMP